VNGSLWWPEMRIGKKGERREKVKVMVAGFKVMSVKKEKGKACIE